MYGHVGCCKILHLVKATNGSWLNFWIYMEVKERGDRRAMARLISALFLVCFAAGSTIVAEQPSFYQLLPDSVQAVAWIRNAEELSNRWDQTLLSELTTDPALRQFFDGQQESIQKKLIDAGWRLGVKPQDLAPYLKGQVAIAWMEKSEARKPFAMAFLADIEDDPATIQQMLKEIDDAIAKNKATKKQLSHLDQQITHYVLPKRPGQLLDENSFLATSAGKLIISDDVQLLKDLIDKLAGKSVAGKALAEDVDFIASRQLLEIRNTANIEFFIRPLGLAKVIRDIGGKRSRNGADLLVVLKNQGFGSVKAVSGEVWLAEGDTDISHRGYVLADQPLPKAAAVLDFPNQALTDIPKFVNGAATSYLATKWNSQEAFWKLESLVDEVTGTPGTFKEVIHGFKADLNGPQVDIRSELLPLFTNDIVAFADNQEGEVQPNSRRNLIALRVNDAVKASKLVERVMKNEAKAQLKKYGSIEIWEFSNELEEANSDFSDFGAVPEDEAEKETWLNQWAICVKDDWIMFSSHAAMLHAAIDQVAKNDGRLEEEADFVNTKRAVLESFGEDPCAWKIARNQLAFRVQYELFRQGKLQESESMLATILGKILEDDSELQNKKSPIINGQNLPPYEQVAKFLRPSGFKIIATDRGWSFGGLLVGKSKGSNREPIRIVSPQEPVISGSYKIGTAQLEVKAAESKR